MQKRCRVSPGTGQIPKGRRRPEAVKTKVDKLTRWAESVRIECDFPNSVRLHGTRREKVNYLRHECTTYDDTLDDTYGSSNLNTWKNILVVVVAVDRPLDHHVLRALKFVDLTKSNPTGACQITKIEQNL